MLSEIIFIIFCFFTYIIVFQGDQPHCGFPEKNFEVHAEKLARKVNFFKFLISYSEPL